MAPIGQLPKHSPHCVQHYIPIACAYFAQVCEYDPEILEFMEEELMSLIGDNYCPDTRDLTQDMIKDSSNPVGFSFVYKACPTYIGDSVAAMEDPLGKYADVLIRVLNCLRIAV